MPSSKASLCPLSRSIRFGSRVPRPFASVTSPKRSDREGLGESRAVRGFSARIGLFPLGASENCSFELQISL